MGWLASRAAASSFARARSTRACPCAGVRASPAAAADCEKSEAAGKSRRRARNRCTLNSLAGRQTASRGLLQIKALFRGRKAFLSSIELKQHGRFAYSAGRAFTATSERIEIMAVENTPARIGKTIVICGEVKGSEDLLLDGRVEGTVTLGENRLTIGPNAQIAANLSAKDVLIMGRVQGNVVARGRVELRGGCSVEGDIRALRLAVEDNAIFRGKVDLTQAAVKGSDVSHGGGF